MDLRERIGLNFPPVLLRLMLATIFIWAGLGKIMSHTEYAGERAAALANMGAISPAPAGGTAITSRPYTAADFPEPVRALRVHGLALTIHRAAHPLPVAPPNGGAPVQPRAIWPASLGDGAWPRSLAWAAAFTELIGGVCLLAGLLTRLWALAIAGIMLGAIWLTEIGPAIQAGQTVLGFLPAYERFAPLEWQRLMFQFALLMSAVALVFLGPGRASIDHALFGPSRDEDDDDDED